MSAGRVPAMINFTAGAANILAACQAAEIDTIVTSRAFVEKGRLGNLIAALAKKVRDRLSRGHPRRPSRFADKLRGLLGAKKPLVARKPDDWAVDPVHLGLGGRAEGRRALPPQHAGQRRAGRGAHRFRPRGQGVQRAAGVPLVRADGGRRAAARVRRADLSLSVAAALPHGAGAGLRRERHHPVRHRHLPHRLCARGASVRLPLAALHPGRRRAGEGIDAADLSGKIRPAHPRRLRRHRDRAGARAQHADVQQVRHRRPHAAGHGGAARPGRRRRGGRPALRARAERDARLSARRQSRRARAAAGRLARHRRHRRPSTSRASSPSRAAPSASPRSAAR